MLRALIVEDNATFRQSLKGVLQTEFPAMIIDEASEGKEAMDKIPTFGPDLIFMDIKLPGENGLELTKRIKTSHADIVVIIVTSYDLPEYREAAQAYGADHFISKGSSTREEILQLIQSVLSNQDL